MNAESRRFFQFKNRKMIANGWQTDLGVQRAPLPPPLLVHGDKDFFKKSKFYNNTFYIQKYN